jgi:hypothetical protein
VLLILTPTLLTVILVGGHLHSDLLNYAPYASDEVYYWRQVETFRTVGFAGGYYAHHELPAAFSFTRFGAWGPLYPMIYGTLARGFGWALASAPIYNLALLGAALGLLVWIARPGPTTTAWLVALIGTSYPLLMFAPTNMQESLSHALGIVLAGLFSVLLRDGHDRQHDTPGGQSVRQVALILFALVTLAALIRVTWAFLYLPLLLLTGDWRRTRWVALRVAVTVILIGLMAGLSRGMAGPYPYALNNILGTLRTSFGEGLFLLWGYIAMNLRTLLVGGEGTGITPLQLLLHYQLLGGVVVCAILIGAALRRRRGAGIRALMEQRRDAALHFLNLAPVLGFVLIYFVGYWIHYRHLGMHLLFSAVVLALRQQGRWVAVIVASNVLFAGVFLADYAAVSPKTAAFHPDMDRLRRFQQVAAQHIRYDPAAGPWCNTVLAHNTFDQRFLLLPPEVGYSVILIWDEQRLPPRSQYIVSDPTMEPRLRGLRLERLATVDDLILYRNLDADCPPPTATSSP